MIAPSVRCGRDGSQSTAHIKVHGSQLVNTFEPGQDAYPTSGSQGVPFEPWLGSGSPFGFRATYPKPGPNR